VSSAVYSVTRVGFFDLTIPGSAPHPDV